jgi:molybdate transport system regulatory protein
MAGAMKPNSEIRPVVRLHLWLETHEGIFFGLGRMMLLKKIHEGQSLRSAAKFLGMSYRAAWGKIKNTEKVLGVALIERKAGRRAGYRLTEDGIALMVCFNHWFKDVERYALRRGRKILPCAPIAFKGTSSSNPVDPLDDPVQKTFLLEGFHSP